MRLPTSSCAGTVERNDGDPMDARIRAVPFVGHARLNAEREAAAHALEAALADAGSSAGRACGSMRAAAAMAAETPHHRPVRDAASRCERLLRNLAKPAASGDVSGDPGLRRTVRDAAASLRRAKASLAPFASKTAQHGAALDAALDQLAALDELLDGVA